MSKSIYEEAIEILLNMGTEFISVPCNPIGEENSDMIHLRDATETYEKNMQGVVKALEQAQEQEKLLELYKQALTGDLGEFIINSQKQEKFLDLYRKFYKYYDNLTLDNLMDTKNKLRELKIKIKALENDS